MKINEIFSAPGAAKTRHSSKMTKYVECWGADKPFANITDSKMAKNIGLAVSCNIYYKLLIDAPVTVSIFLFNI